MRIRQSLVLGAVLSVAIPHPAEAFTPPPAQDGKTAAAVGPSGSNPQRKKTIAKPLVTTTTQYDPSTLQAQSAAVVKVRVKRTDGSSDQATGLFVGIKSEDAYFITALHAIVEDPHSDFPVLVKSIQVQFRNSKGLDAVAEPKISQALDLGVLRVPASKLPRSLPRIVMKDAAVGIPVHILGYPADGDWSVWSGDIENATVSDNPRLFRTSTNDSLKGGFSGGPVLDYDGAFLGMHTSTTSSYGTASKSRAIADQLNAWTIPTDNLTTQPQPPPSGPGPVTAESQVEADSKAIDRVLNAYEAAYNRKDEEALWRIWPSAPVAVKRDIVNYFKSARSISRSITARKIMVDGTNATATGQYSDEFISANGMKQTSPVNSISFTLERRNVAWTITSVK